MNPTLAKRLNEILPLITDPTFLSGEGIGNEIACYIFDHPAKDELQVRAYIKNTLTPRLKSHHGSKRVLYIDLLDMVLDYLKQRGFLSKALEMQVKKGNAAVLRALKGPLAAEKIRDFIATERRPADHDLVILSGIGSVWPMLRAHNLLNCLHTIMGQTPLVMFYPGTFDGTGVGLFGRAPTPTGRPEIKPYYRAFILVPGAPAP